MSRTCSINGCEKPSECRDLCGVHYKRLRRHGDPGPAHIEPREPTRITKQKAHAERRREARFEDVREMISWHVHPDEIARRIGASRAAIVRQAHNWGAADIARYLAVHKAATKPCPDCGDDIQRSSTRCVDCAHIARWVKGAA